MWKGWSREGMLSQESQSDVRLILSNYEHTRDRVQKMFRECIDTQMTVRCANCKSLGVKLPPFRSTKSSKLKKYQHPAASATRQERQSRELSLAFRNRSLSTIINLGPNSDAMLPIGNAALGAGRSRNLHKGALFPYTLTYRAKD
jgi:hypothetical protein